MWDFNVYGLRDYNVIQIRDWLSPNQALLDFEKNRVLQGLCNNEMRIIFQRSLLNKSSCIVSYVKAKKMMEQGCQAFITSLVNSMKNWQS